MKRFSKWLENITRINWGMPYHLFAGYLLTHIASLFIAPILSALAAMTILVLYELYQYFTERWKYIDFWADARQDMIANLIGAGVAIFVLYAPDLSF